MFLSHAMLNKVNSLMTYLFCCITYYIHQPNMILGTIQLIMIEVFMEYHKAVEKNTATAGLWL